MKTRIYAVIAGVLLMGSGLIGQSGQGVAHTVISIEISESDYKKLHKPRTSDLEFDDASVVVGGTAAEVQSLRTRGKSSLKQYRKSFTVELEDRVCIEFSSGIVELKDFYLISMSMDRHYFYNRFAFDCLKECGIFPLRYRYVEVVVNGICEGLYILVERPFDYMLDVLESPYALRRLRSGQIDKDKVGKGVESSEVNTYRANYLDLVSIADNNKGEKAYEALNEVIDMTAYLRWLAFNYIVRNGDYTDEVYYYIIPGSGPPRFTILPWDYDDIFMKEPHEGEEQKRRVLGHKLFFSSEDPFDRQLANNDYIYSRYLDELEATLDRLNASVIRASMDQIKQELVSYLSDEDITAALTPDYYGGSDVESMTEHMEGIYNYIVERNVVIRKRIEVARAD